jgi:hypothetical protein
MIWYLLLFTVGSARVASATWNPLHRRDTMISAMPMTVKQTRLLATIIVPFQVVGAVLPRRDLARRTEDQVRGNKRAWRVFVSMNPGDSVIYWLFGRR